MDIGGEDFRARISKICEEWDKAEATIKLAEQVCESVVFPSVKELRYAGRRIIDALHVIGSDESSGIIYKYLQDAEFNCHRSRHDAIDAATAKISIELEIAKKKLGYNAIVSAFPHFTKLRSKLNGIRSKIRESRGDRENRERIYRDIEEADFDNIVELYNEFQENEEVMKDIALRERRSTAISWLISAVGIIIGVVSLIF